MPDAATAVLIALAFYRKVDVLTAYGLLLISSVLAFAALTAARVTFPVPSRLEEGGPPTAKTVGFTRAYWLT